MKTTFDIPDLIYREFKVKTAMNGETMRNATLAMIISYNVAGGNPLNAAATSGRSVKTADDRLPSWAGIAEKFITRYPDDPLDNESVRDAIVDAKKRGAL